MVRNTRAMDKLFESKNSVLGFAESLFPINRSLSGEGNRQTLSRIKEYLPLLRIIEVPTGTECFDWIVPPEWKVRQAYIMTPSGHRICCFHKNNLHLVGYSTAFAGYLDLEELQEYLYSNPELPEAIPYVTSYYERKWGFCISENERKSLEKGLYEVCVDTVLFEGSMSVGEVIIPGVSEKEIFLSTYICHPSMANNEVSGPTVLTTILQKLLNETQKLPFTIRAIFIPETIGSIYYLSKHLKHLKSSVVAGFNFTCVGDERVYSLLGSKYGNTYADQVARHVLVNTTQSPVFYDWRERGSDERQYCAPGVDLPFISLMRSKHTEYPEYHSSLDTIGDVVTADGLWGGYLLNLRAIQAVLYDCRPLATVIGEPKMSKYDLYPKTTDGKRRPKSTRLLMNILTWADGTNSLLDIADKVGVPIWELYAPVELLFSKKLIEKLK